MRLRPCTEEISTFSINEIYNSELGRETISKNGQTNFLIPKISDNIESMSPLRDGEILQHNAKYITKMQLTVRT